MPSSTPSVAEIRAVAQPPGLLERRSGEHWAGRLYMRRLSPYATWLAVRAGLTANTLTGAMIFVGLLGAAALAIGGLVGPVIAFLAIQLYLLLDCSDGEVARWRHATSMIGVYLDRLGHYVVEAAVMIGLGLHAGQRHELAWVVWGLVAGLFVMLSKAETDLVDVARHRSGVAPARDDDAIMTDPRLAAGRRAAGRLPLHRITHAVEATILVLLAAVGDAIVGSTIVTRSLMVAMTCVAALVVVLHLVSVLTSRRLVTP
jgi:hypothetical protein